MVAFVKYLHSQVCWVTFPLLKFLGKATLRIAIVLCLSAFFERRNLTLRGELPTGLDCVQSVFGLSVSFTCLFRCLFVCVPVYFSEIVVVLKKPRGHSWLGSSALK